MREQDQGEKFPNSGRLPNVVHTASLLPNPNVNPIPQLPRFLDSVVGYIGKSWLMEKPDGTRYERPFPIDRP